MRFGGPPVTESRECAKRISSAWFVPFVLASTHDESFSVRRDLVGPDWIGNARLCRCNLCLLRAANRWGAECVGDGSGVLSPPSNDRGQGRSRSGSRPGRAMVGGSAQYREAVRGGQRLLERDCNNQMETAAVSGSAWAFYFEGASRVDTRDGSVILPGCVRSARSHSKSIEVRSRRIL